MSAERKESQGPVGKVLRALLAPVFYWLDLNGPDGRPCHGKVMSTGVIVVFLPVTCYLGYHIAQAVDDKQVVGGWLTAAFVTLVTFLVSAAFGADVLKAWLKSRGGGTTDALTEALKHVEAAARVRTQAFDDGSPAP